MCTTKRLLSLLLIFTFSVTLIAGCGYKSIKHGTEITNEQVTTKIVDGQTTKEDILIEFGDPSKTMNGEKAYFYTWTRGGKGSLLGFGSGSAYTHSLVIIFDDNGIVKNHKITRGTTEATTDIAD